MKLRRVYRFKLEPSHEQIRRLYQLAGSRRFVYNWALARRNSSILPTAKGPTA